MDIFLHVPLLGGWEKMNQDGLREKWQEGEGKGKKEKMEKKEENKKISQLKNAI